MLVRLQLEGLKARRGTARWLFNPRSVAPRAGRKAPAFTERGEGLLSPRRLVGQARCEPAVEVPLVREPEQRPLYREDDRGEDPPSARARVVALEEARAEQGEREEDREDRAGEHRGAVMDREAAGRRRPRRAGRGPCWRSRGGALAAAARRRAGGRRNRARSFPATASLRRRPAERTQCSIGPVSCFSAIRSVPWRPGQRAAAGPRRRPCRRAPTIGLLSAKSPEPGEVRHPTLSPPSELRVKTPRVRCSHLSVRRMAALRSMSFQPARRRLKASQSHRRSRSPRARPAGEFGAGTRRARMGLSESRLSRGQIERAEADRDVGALDVGAQAVGEERGARHYYYCG